MTERGNDELLGPKGREHVERKLAGETFNSYAEQARVEAQTPSDDEPGKDYPDPDEAPDG